jgi:hypothetical protein
MTKVSGMAVTVTLVFADESHREAWLLEQGIIAREMPPQNEQGEYLVPDGMDRERRKPILQRIDYNRRCTNTDLQYTVGPISTSCSDSDSPTTRG